LKGDKMKIFNISQIEELKKFEKTKKEYDGFVYVIDLGTQVKIGKSHNISQRILYLKRIFHTYSDIHLLRIAVTDPHMNYNENEKLMHTAFSDFRNKGELFDVDFETASLKLYELKLNTSDKERKQKVDDSEKFLQTMKESFLPRKLEIGNEDNAFNIHSAFYAKIILNGKCVRIPISNDSVFTICPRCKKEIIADIDDLITMENFDFYSTVVYCMECTEKRMIERIENC
jgi:hypothetical protein